MRKEARAQKNVRIAGVQGYHAGHRMNIATNHNVATIEAHEVYAFQGFSGNWYFNSDRKIALDRNFQREDGQPLQGYGIELEMESLSITNQTVLADVMDKIIFPLFNGLVTIVSGFFSDKLGRKKVCLLFGLLTLAGLVVFILACRLHWGPAAAGIAYGCSIGGLWSMSDTLILTMPAESTP
ncbi:MAG: hypothetical protein J6T47_08690, partial [Lachnospiraceae bacterium]|nr:hypothetical protein [Lachnospiraceae bacterium]